MLDALFQSVFQTSSVVVEPLAFFLSVLVSLGLGLVLAGIYRYKQLGSKEFSLTLALLPCLIGLIIFLVNGNLGTSVAVAGAFSLIKFRSPASSSRELLLVFMATAIGLATGMGYLALATSLTGLVALVFLLLETSGLFESTSRSYQLTLLLPRDEDSSQLEASLGAMAELYQLDKVQLKSQQLELTYLLVTSQAPEQLLDKLLSLNPNWSAQLSPAKQKKKSL